MLKTDFISYITIAFLFLDSSSAAIAERAADIKEGGQTVEPGLAGGSQSEKDEFRLDRAYWKSYLTDTRDILESPLHWGKFDFLEAGLITGATIGLYAEDQKIKNWAQRKQNRISNHISAGAKPFGNGIYTLPPLAALYLYGHYRDEAKPQRTAMLGLESFVVADLFTSVLKDIGHRHRPISGDPYNRWDGPGFSRSNQSFPSGHATAAFAVLTIIASEYRNNAFIPPLAYGIAMLTALSRVNDNKHWASDVFVGSAIGFFTAKSILRLHNSNNKGKLTVFPVFDYRYAGLAVSLN